MIRGNRDRKKSDEDLAKLDTERDRIRPAKARKPVVTVYVTKDCPGCKVLVDLLRDNKVAFKKRDVNKTKQGREFYASIGGELPITTIDADVVRGYDPEKVFRTIQKKSLPPGEGDSYRF